MERKIPVRTSLFVLFSTIIVYSDAFGQTSDDLYRKLRKNPSLQKEANDQLHSETLNRARLEKLEQEKREYDRQVALDEKQAPIEPDLPEEPSKSTGAGMPPPKIQGSNPSAPATAPRTVAAPAAPSSQNPKVSFDPMPAEIQFPGETVKPAVKKPTAKKPQKRQQR